MDDRILLSFELPDGDRMTESLAADLADMEIVALGHFGLPEQTPPEVGRDQFLDEAEAALTDRIRPLTDRGASVETRIVFGRARDKTIDRVAVEEGCGVIVTPGTEDASGIDRVLVPVRGAENFADVLSFAAALALDCDAELVVFHQTEETDRQPGEELLADAVERLTAEGVPRERISTELAEGDDVQRAIVDRTAAFDAVVLGESEPSLRDRVFGSRLAGVTLDADRPTFVVRDLSGTE